MINFPEQPHLYTYNKHHQRLHFDRHPYYFFGSGSSGNSVYLKQSHLLIDLGFPFKKYTDMSPLFWYDVRYVLLTHEHGDHLNEATLMRILDEYPHIQFLISKRMFNRITGPMFYKRFNDNKERAYRDQEMLQNKYYQRFHFIDGETSVIHLYQNDLTLAPVDVYPHLVSHADIINVAYEIKTHNHHILYSSDLDHVFAPQRQGDDSRIDNSLSLPLEYDAAGRVTFFKDPFDIIFLEANYDHDFLINWINQHPEDAHARGNLRHISEQETWRYIQYALSDQGIFIPLHASTTFGTLVQDLSGETESKPLDHPHPGKNYNPNQGFKPNADTQSTTNERSLFK